MTEQLSAFPVSAKWYKWIFILLGFMLVCQILAALQEPWLEHISQQFEAGEITAEVCSEKGTHIIILCNILLVLSTIALTIVGLKIAMELKNKGLGIVFPSWILVAICGWLFCFGQVGLSVVRYEQFCFENTDEMFRLFDMFNSCAYVLYALVTLTTGLLLVIKCRGHIRQAGMLLMVLVVIQAFVPLFNLSVTPILSFFITVLPFMLLTICMALFVVKE